MIEKECESLKKVTVFISFCVLVFLTACASSEAKEIVEYHNEYVENVNKKALKVDKALAKFNQASTFADTLKIFKEEVDPLVQDIKKYILSQEPETEVVKELNLMRVDQLKAWSKAFELRLQALEKANESSPNEAEITDLTDKSNKSFDKFNELGEKANKRFMELAEEYNVELEDAEEK